MGAPRARIPIYAQWNASFSAFLASFTLYDASPPFAQPKRLSQSAPHRIKQKDSPQFALNCGESFTYVLLKLIRRLSQRESSAHLSENSPAGPFPNRGECTFTGKLASGPLLKRSRMYIYQKTRHPVSYNDILATQRSIIQRWVVTRFLASPTPRRCDPWQPWRRCRCASACLRTE